MKLNKEQQLAVDTIDKNVCVVAGAGTGKTQILTKRFVNIIKSSNLDSREAMESILAITFTKKATREMISRISKEIEILAKDDERYIELINYIPFLNISTIDSFCKNIVDENRFILGLDNDYEIVSESEGNEILEEIINKILYRRLKEDEVLKEYMVNKQYIRVMQFSSSLKIAYKKIVNKGYDFDELLDLYPDMNMDDSDLEKLFSDLNFYYNDFVENKYANGRHGLVTDYKKGLFNELEIKNDKEVIIQTLNVLKGRFNAINKAPQEYREKIDLEITNAIMWLQKDEYKYYELINDILKEIDTVYRKTKLENGKLLFEDLLYYTKKLLKNEEIANSYKEKFKYIMIDEFQDTNKTQRDIFYALASNSQILDRNNFFVVGDPKQSIYGFRGSDLNVFMESIEDIKNSGGEIIELKENYRSSRNIIDYSNELFEKIMGEKYSDIIPKAELPQRKIEYINIVDENLIEGEIISEKILELKNNGRSFSDIAVLFRSVTNLKKLEDALNSKNIPYINPKSKGFYDKREIKDLILFLKVLNYPKDSESLYGLLRSNFFLIDDDLLFEISQGNKKSLYENLMDYESDDKILNRAKDLLKEFVGKKDQINTYELLSEIILKTNYYSILSFISNTPQSIENVRKFEDMAMEYSIENNDYISDFLNYIVFNSKEESNEATVEMEDEAVNLMTIHGSKGLEFPIVIFYDSVNAHRRMNSGTEIEVHKDLGYGIKVNDYSAMHKYVSDENDKEDKEERDRLLYVCITRAKEHFVFCNINKEETEKIKENSFLESLTFANEENFEITSNINRKAIEEIPIGNISTNGEGILENKNYKNNKKDVFSSITGFNLFNKCRREYYYRYKLGVKDTNLKLIENTDREVDSEIEFNNDLRGMDALSYGTLVHKIIEEFDTEITAEEQIKNILESKGLIQNEVLYKSILKHINSFASHNASHNIEGKKFFEFGFLQKFKEGYLSGSIDQLVQADDGVVLVDFKTNQIKNLEKLKEHYTPQLRLYSMVTRDMFGEIPKKSLIHFLTNNVLEEITWDEEENKKLENSINSFLRFIRDNDSIDTYECSSDCNEYCKFINICDRS